VDDLAAEVTVADIGIPTAAERFVGPGDIDLARPDGRAGRPYIIGGGPYTGAPALAAQAALRASAELSFVAAPESVAGEIQGYSEDLIVQPYESDVLTPERAEDLLETAQQYDNVVVLGPGLGTADETLEAARQFLESYTGRVVVDADALAVVPDLETDATLVCTPNRRELARMGGPDVDDLADVADEIEAFAAELGHVVLAKGATDVITDGERTRLSRSGTAGMKVGGTGDTLAGIVAALLEHAEPLDAAAAGPTSTASRANDWRKPRPSVFSPLNCSRKFPRPCGVVRMSETPTSGRRRRGCGRRRPHPHHRRGRRPDGRRRRQTRQRATRGRRRRDPPAAVDGRGHPSGRDRQGDVLATARVGAIQAVKHTWETIPMCHQIPITNVDTDFSLAEDRIELRVAVETTGKTGCEMEALEGVTTGLNVVWDMVKAVEKDEDGQYPDTGIENVRVLAKEKERA